MPMSNGETQKVVQIPEDTFRKMREKLKKQDERIKSLETQLTTTATEKENVAQDPGQNEVITQLNQRIDELQAVIENQKAQFDGMQREGAGDEQLAAVSRELAEKEELIKQLMERERQLMETLENSSQPRAAGPVSGHLEKGMVLIQKLEEEMKTREGLIDTLFSKVVKVKEAMGMLEQELLNIPTQEDLDNEVREVLKVINSQPTTLTADMNPSYETILDRIKQQLDKSVDMKNKIFQEQENVALKKKGLIQRFDFLAGNLDGLTKSLKEKEERLNSARDFFEAKYKEWKAQDEARAREMENLWGLISAD
jgi:DNA repair exonuclease SbcCD ATPase subunit